MEKQLNKISKIKALIVLVSFAVLIALLIVAYMSRSVIASRAIPATDSTDLTDAARVEQLLERTALDAADIDALKSLAEIETQKGNFAESARLWEEVSSLSPLEADPIYQWGRSLYMKGDIVLSQQVLSDGRLSENIPAGLLLARIAMSQGNLATAQMKLGEILLLAPDNEDALLLKADIAVGKKQLEQAAALYSSLTSSRKTEVRTAAAVGLAQVAIRNKDLTLSVSLLDAVERADLPVGLADVMARLYLQAGEVDKGLEQFQQLIDTYGARTGWVIEMAEQLAGRENREGIQTLRLGMADVDFVSVSGRYYLDALVSYLNSDCPIFLDEMSWASSHNNRPLAVWLRLDCSTELSDLEAFNEVATSENISLMAQPIKDRLYVTLLRRAAFAINLRQSDLGIAMSQLAQKLRKESVDADLMLGRALLSKGDFNAAVNAVASYIDGEARNANALEVAGRARLEQKQYEQAMIYFSSLIKDEELTKASLGYYWAGITSQGMGLQQQAEQYLLSAYEMGYKDKSGIALMGIYLENDRLSETAELADWFVAQEDKFRKSVGYSYHAAIAAAEGHFNEAGGQYLKAIEHTPERIPLYLSAADNFIAAGAFDDAENILAKAQSVESKNIYVMFKLAYAAEQADLRDLAAERYRKLISFEPRWALPIYNLASMLKLEENQLNEAYRLASKAHTLSPNWSLATELYQELGERVSVQSEKIDSVES